jgi:hypothetical protein
MASDSGDFGGENKSLETARRLLEETFTSEAEAEALPSLPSGFYDAFVLRGIRVVQALQPGTLLCHFNVPSRLLVSQLSLSLSLSLSAPESSSESSLIPE